MTTTSDRPITVDGVRLDTLAWNIEKITRQVAARRDANAEVSGRDGVIPSLNDTLEEGRLGLDMFVMGTDPDGAVPAEGRRDRLWANLDELVHLFGKRHALLEVRETVLATGNERRAWAKVQDTIEPELDTPGGSGRFTVSLVLPYGVWEDVATQDWAGAAGAASGTVQNVTTLDGATERIQDAVVLVTGPATNPRVTDTTTGAYVELQATLTAADTWRVNVGTWSTRTGNLTLDSSDTAGADQQPVTKYGGTRNQATFLPLTPVRDAGLRRVKIALSGTGFTASTRVSVRARRKFAL